MIMFKVMKGKNLQPIILFPASLSFKFNGEIKVLLTSKSKNDSAPPNQLYKKYEEDNF